jgi:hypothetical protein
MNHRASLGLVIMLLGLMVAAADLRADQFRLKDGRVLTGKLIRSDSVQQEQRQETRLAIEMEPGVLIGIFESDLARNGHSKNMDREEMYRVEVAKLEQTAEAHFQMGQWCTKNEMRDLARAHYLRTIDLDPNHKLARSFVNHTLSETTGRWVRREEQMAERGKVLYKGKWQFPEYIPMDEGVDLEKKQKGLAQKEVSRLHNDFLRGNSEKSQLAAQQLSQLDNPLAVGYISQLVLEKQRGGLPAATPALKQLYITVLSRYDFPSVAMTLAHVSVNDAEQSVRNAAIDVLARQGRMASIPVLASYLRSKNNVLVNRAGAVLGQLNAREVILPMIEALITQHEFQGSTNDNFSSGGLALGGPKKQRLDLQNESVLAALSQITGQGQFGYDKAAWRAWYASMYAPPAQDLRRDL